MERKIVPPQQLGVVAPIIGITVTIFATLTLLAGLPPAENMAGFMLGIVVLIAFTIGIGLLAWHLLLRPLPAHLRVISQDIASARARSIIALLLTLGTLSIGIAGVWDEIWHSKYGIPFGQDFFWRPHLMLYFGFTTVIVVGVWSWWAIINRGKGTMQQRFRASPLLGVTFLAAVYTIYALAADPVWHKLYGADLAPWSLPHLLILIMILAMALLAITYHKSLMPQSEWRVGFSFVWRDILILLVLVGALVDYMLIFTIQWYAAGTATKQLGQVLAYPDWLLAVFITFLAMLIGGLALYTTRRIGSATLVGVITFGVRFFLDHGLGGVRDGTSPLLLIVPLLITLDVLYAIAVKRTKQPPALWLTAGVVALMFGLVEYPLIIGIFPFLPVSVLNIPARIVASAITAGGTMWLAQVLGGIGNGETASAVSDKSAIWENMMLYGVYAVFLVFFIVTAVPPVK